MIALNAIYFSPYEYGLDLEALIMFALGSFLIISILLFYYNRIPKSNSTKDALENAIYQPKDILLQISSNDSNLIITQSSTSTWAKILVFILILLVAITPLDQLLF